MYVFSLSSEGYLQLWQNMHNEVNFHTLGYLAVSNHTTWEQELENTTGH